MNDLEFRKKQLSPNFTFYQFEADDIWDDIEIFPIAQISETVFEPCEIGQENFWSVFLHFQKGGIYCVTDLPTEFFAIQFANLLYRQRYKIYNPVIFPVLSPVSTT